MLSLQGLDKFNSVCESIRYLEEKVVGLHPANNSCAIHDTDNDLPF